MNQPFVPTGADPDSTSEDMYVIYIMIFFFSTRHSFWLLFNIFRINAELRKLQLYRNTVGDANEQYLQRHPELKTILDDFVTSVIVHKPSDLVNFGIFYFNNLRKNGKVGPCPIIVAGPSGVGKGTIINKLLEAFPDVFGFSVSHTTRAPRDGEVNGVHYHFVTKADFEEAVERGDFVEYAKVHTNYYGTSFQAIETVS